ncbi:MAG: alpha/beta fold hydrolase [Candidatus Kryptoniota bacterium]
MSTKIHIFKSPETKAQYDAAYEAMLKRWPIPYQEIFVPTRFGDTHIIASGSQATPPLILFHSAGSGAVQWFRNVGALSEHYRTYAVDVIGEVNRSNTTQKLHTRQEFVDWTTDLFSGLNIASTNLVGNSFGGFLAINTAFYLPERVKKVVLISPAATFLQMWSFYWHIAFPYKIGYKLGSKRLIMSGFNWIWQDFPKDECLSRYIELGKTGGFPSNQFPPPVYTDQELREIHTPILLLIGDHEVIYKPERVISRATRLVTGLKAEIIPNANHNAQVTAPDVVNKKILDFFTN